EIAKLETLCGSGRTYPSMGTFYSLSYLARSGGFAPGVRLANPAGGRRTWANLPPDRTEIIPGEPLFFILQPKSHSTHPNEETPFHGSSSQQTSSGFQSRRRLWPQRSESHFPVPVQGQEVCGPVLLSPGFHLRLPDGNPRFPGHAGRVRIPQRAG